MGTITDRLAPHRSIGLDTSIFIYHLEANPKFLSITQEILSGIEAGTWIAVASTIALMELTVHPWKQGRSDVAQQYEAILVNFPHLSLINVDRDVARRAAQLRANYNIRPADAIHVATAMVNGATAFVSNDHKFQRLGNIIDIVILDDLLTNG